MEFRKMSVGLYSYGSDNANCEDAVLKDVTNFNFTDDKFRDHLKDKSHPNHKNIENILLHLACCHTVVVDTKEDK